MTSYRWPCVIALIAIACSPQRDVQQLPLPTATPTDRFWALVETARASGDHCHTIANRLTDTLATLPPSSIVEFDTELTARRIESYRWDLWAVAYVANGGASDDGFDYFRGWLITRGREAFERALRDPPAAVEGAPRVGDLECEDVLGAAYVAYQKKTGQTLPRVKTPWPATPAGKPWSEETIDQVYPGLTARVRER